MMLARGFLAEGKEYLVLEGNLGFMPGSAAIRLLMDRNEGAGADRVLISAGIKVQAFLPDGQMVPLSARDQQVLGRARADYELRLTDWFVSLMREADEAAELERAS